MKRTTLRMITMLFSLCMLAGISACANMGETAAAATRLTLEGKLADTLLEQGTPQQVVLAADLSEAEMQRFITALDTYELIAQKWQGVTDNPETITRNLIMVSTDYATLYGEYQAVRQIAQSHWAEYSPVQRSLLGNYHDRAVSIHQQMQTLLVNSRRVEATAALVDLGILVAKAAVL